MNNLKIYTNKSNQNIINKRIDLISELNCTFKDDIDMLNPVLLVKKLYRWELLLSFRF